MILLSILSALKTLLFINMTSIEWNRMLIFFTTIFITVFIMSTIDMWNSKYKNILLISFYTIISSIMLVDVIYFSYFTSLPSVKMLGQVGQLHAVSDSVKNLFTFKNLLFIIDIPLVFLYFFKYKNKLSKRPKNEKEYLIPLASLLIVALLFGKANISGEINSLKLQEIFSFHFTDIVNSQSDKKQVAHFNNDFDPNSSDSIDINVITSDPTDPSKGFNEGALKEYQKRARLKDGKYTGIGKGRNLIVIQVEALQGFVMDLVYEGQEISPNLNKLAHDQSSLYYDEYYQLVGRGNTSDAEFVTNNSLHPSMETPTYSQYEENTFYGLPWLLRDNGYKAWAFHGYEKEFWNREAAYKNQGFERFISDEDFNFQEVIGLGITDKDFFHQSIDYLKELEDDPYYAFLVTLTSHNPYHMPSKYHVLKLKPEHKDTLLGNYLQSIRYFDDALGEFIEDLKEEGIYDKSVIALYGDHFAIQNTNEEISALMTDFLGHRYNYDDIMNIPLIIHLPGEELGETISTVSSQLDFFPTISNIMGYDNIKGLVFGKDINNYDGYANVKPQTIMRKGSFVDKDTIFAISRTEIFAHSKAYDRNTGEQLEIDDYRHIYDRTIKEINDSEFVLRNDLMKYLIKEQEELNFESLGKENEISRDKILKTYKTGSQDIINELDLWYKDGSRMFALNITSSIALDPIIKWSKEQADAHILFRNSDGDKVQLFENMKYRYNVFKKDAIVEINAFDEHYYITSYGYENLLLNVTEQDYTDTEILDFLKVQKLFAVVLDEKRINTDLPEKIKELGIEVYVESEEELSIYE